MNFIQLVQKAIRYSGARIDAPSSVSDATGLARDFVDYVNDAWRDIQMERPEWYFRTKAIEVDLDKSILEKGQKLSRTAITPPSSGSWNFISLYNVHVIDPDDERDQPTPLRFVPFNFYYSRWGKSEAQLDANENIEQEGRPQRFTIAPTGEVWINPIPDKRYVMHFFGPNRIQQLCDDCDEPFFPPEYHDMIVWRAIRDWAMYQQDSAMMEKARIRYLPLKKSLDSEYLSQITLKTGQFYEHIR